MRNFRFDSHFIIVKCRFEFDKCDEIDLFIFYEILPGLKTNFTAKKRKLNFSFNSLNTKTKYSCYYYFPYITKKTMI